MRRYTEQTPLRLRGLFLSAKAILWAYYSQIRKGGGHAPPQDFGYR